MYKNNSQKGKYLVFSADDFGIDFDFNLAVQEGFQKGFLTSACICANGKAFNHAIMEVIPSCPDLGLGVHLNIIEGKTLRNKISRTSALYNSDGTYRHGFLGLLVNSTSDRLLKEIEIDFRLQIEKILDYISVDHINSHVHTHAVPAIFEMVCRLANEYRIPFVRTQHEKVYKVPEYQRYLNKWYPVNLAKIAVLNTCTEFNRNTLQKYGIKSNDYLIGIGYTGHMDSKTIKYGLKRIDDNRCITEILIHPGKFVNMDLKQVLADEHKKSRLIEFQTTLDMELLNEMSYQGWTLTNFARLR